MEDVCGLKRVAARIGRKRARPQQGANSGGDNDDGSDLDGEEVAPEFANV